ncbi:hypothetical protein [Roseateles terrae]|uniref:Uncharacterized protein n=1 Tax=Roseateles terrae TaxID=431060 RepID=A0ABR6GZ69_9BURK|nr:hypothetical protein [Roseateles terrae]MBB3197056.1 hypothetical protein [Roseateles terrae]OWQ84221.1 hypothetical protein CDN98_19755 [Roseateles terrae]
MFRASAAPFLPGVPHLYTAAAFDAPPQLPAPDLPSEWTAYHCIDPIHEGSFDDFKASALFAATQQQFLDRCTECEAFADAQFSPEDAQAIRTGFAAFRRNLLKDNGETFFTGSLTKLYSIGKRHFDRFCLRLRQNDLDLHRRKMKLYELSRDLHNCRSSGSAFVHAALGLDSSPGGLQGEFHHLLVARIDALLRGVVNQLPAGVPPYTPSARLHEDHVRRMEVHMVNRLKLELGLPGADASDLFVGGTGLIQPGQVEQCRTLLRDQLRPVLLAQELAQRYIIQLRSELPLAAQDPKTDLAEYMEDLYQVHERLGATFGDVPLNHLLECDPDTGQTHWLNDPALVANDMLVTLARQKLIAPRSPASLLHDHSEGYHWDLMHVDMRLFLVDERRELKDPENLVPVRIGHALEWERQNPALSPIPMLTETLLAARRPDDLIQLPGAWLTDEDQCTAHCRGLGDEGVVRWLSAQSSLPERLRKLLLPALTGLGMPEALQKVMKHPPQLPAGTLFLAAGGQNILLRTIAQGNHYVKAAWYGTLVEAFRDLPQRTVGALFTAGRSCLIGKAMMTGLPMDVSSLMALLQQGVQAGKVTAEVLPSSLHVNPQEVMRAGRLEVLREYADRLCDMFRQGQLPLHLLLFGLGGQYWQRGCTGALEGGHVPVVTWFHGLVAGLHRAGCLVDATAAALLSAAPDHVDSGGMRAICNRHPAALAEHLHQLQEAVAARLIPGDRLPELLACRGRGPRWGLCQMVIQDSEHPCLPVWAAAVSRARHRNLISPADVAELLRSSDELHEAPLLHHLLVLPNAGPRLQAWLRVLATLEHAHGLQMAFHLLDARPLQGHAPKDGTLFRAMAEGWMAGAVSALVALYGQALEHKLITRPELNQLLQSSSHATAPVTALMTAVQELRHEHVAEFLQALLSLAEKGHLDADALLHLLEGGSRTDRTPLSTALALEMTEVVESVLDTALAAAERGYISAEQWCRLLRPAQDGAVWQEIAHCRAPALRETLERAFTRACNGGLLDGPLGFQLAQAWQSLRPPAPSAQGLVTTPLAEAP